MKKNSGMYTLQYSGLFLSAWAVFQVVLGRYMMLLQKLYVLYCLYTVVNWKEEEGGG